MSIGAVREAECRVGDGFVAGSERGVSSLVEGADGDAAGLYVGPDLGVGPVDDGSDADEGGPAGRGGSKVALGGSVRIGAAAAGEKGAQLRMGASESPQTVLDRGAHQRQTRQRQTSTHTRNKLAHLVELVFVLEMNHKKIGNSCCPHTRNKKIQNLGFLLRKRDREKETLTTQQSFPPLKARPISSILYCLNASAITFFASSICGKVESSSISFPHSNNKTRKSLLKSPPMTKTTKIGNKKIQQTR